MRKSNGSGTESLHHAGKFLKYGHVNCIDIVAFLVTYLHRSEEQCTLKKGYI
jgi:hypothetical protein